MVQNSEIINAFKKIKKKKLKLMKKIFKIFTNKKYS